MPFVAVFLRPNPESSEDRDGPNIQNEPQGTGHWWHSEIRLKRRRFRCLRGRC